MKKLPVAAAVLAVVGGICFQVRGSSTDLPADSRLPGHLTNSSARQAIQRPTETTSPATSLPDSPLLVSQTYRTQPEKQHRVALSWIPGGPSSTTGEDVISGYNVYRRNALAKQYTRINSDLVPDANYVDDSVRSGQTYYYQTTAVNNRGMESGPSNQVKVVVPFP
ncbi:MAG: hypothetical protein ACLP6G_06280 [Terriglobales bacterium]